MFQKPFFGKLQRMPTNCRQPGGTECTFVCSGAKKICCDADVCQTMVAELRDRLEKSSDFQLTGQRVDFYGWCPNCANRRDHRTDAQAE